MDTESETFQGRAEPISTDLHAEMSGSSWHPHPRCPAPSALALLRMNHWGMDGLVHHGELVVAAQLADEVLDIFRDIFAVRFPIARMRRIDAYGGDDEASMAANNCSAFNFRFVAGTERLSQHAFGTAIDINPVQNPWVQGDRVLPPDGRAYLDRDDLRPGMIARDGPVTAAFLTRGWDWGGLWDDCRDYHHFAKHPRGPAVG